MLAPELNDMIEAARKRMAGHDGSPASRATVIRSALRSAFTSAPRVRKIRAALDACGVPHRDLGDLDVLLGVVLGTAGIPMPAPGFKTTNAHADALVEQTGVKKGQPGAGRGCQRECVRVLTEGLDRRFLDLLQPGALRRQLRDTWLDVGPLFPITDEDSQ